MMKGYLGKFVLVTVLSLLCHIPLGMVQDVIYERGRSQELVAEELDGEQHLAAPLLVVDILVRYTDMVNIYDKPENPPHKEERFSERTSRLLFAPQETTVRSVLDPEQLHRGIYSLPAYTARMQITGAFDTASIPKVGAAYDGGIIVSVPSLRLLMPIQRPDVLTDPPVIRWNGEPLEAVPGLGVVPRNAGTRGFSADVPVGTFKEGAPLAFSLAMSFHGSHALSFLPIGKAYVVDLESPWPHPRFQGSFLPASREVSKEGFAARWSITEFSRHAAGRDTLLVDWDEPSFSVELIEPVDIYLQCTRAVKYGILFILLTFEFFLLFEILKGLRIHVAQYLMVGAALIIFYLLLISLSEHLGFALAYLTASVACVLLLAAYARSVTKSGRTAAVFGLSLSVLYAALYIILSSEQYSLVMGSGLLFLILAATMYLTRDLDWYALEGRGDYAHLFNRMRSGGEEKPEKKPEKKHEDKPEDQSPLSV